MMDDEEVLRNLWPRDPTFARKGNENQDGKEETDQITKATYHFRNIQSVSLE